MSFAIVDQTMGTSQVFNAIGNDYIDAKNSIEAMVRQGHTPQVDPITLSKIENTVGPLSDEAKRAIRGW